MTERAWRIERLDDPRSMPACALPFLARDEANHTIVLNALATALRRPPGMADAPNPAAQLRLLLLCEDDAVIAVAAHQMEMVFLACADAAQARRLGRELREGPALHGVVGEAKAARACAEAIGGRFHLQVPLRLHVLAGEPQAGRAPGRMRLAQDHDRAMLTAWQQAFEAEAGMVRAPVPAAEVVARRMELGQAYVWCDADDTVVCHAGATHIPPTGARIAPVYTPPAARGRGYAQALVAQVCRRLAEQGAQHQCLFTDARNPASNTVYARVGFRAIADHAHFEFDRG